ncbi:hypothetical protein ACFYXM_08910 [Streptomyces sp. NPDC002476]|uniref:hypothetical protein n=1 Tax=Streptomyces sp. NPDC002476 TaxID=3364648 RepID=UPI0036ABF447
MTSTTICAEYSTHTDQPPVGPCVLRPGHLGHIHQDMRGIQWATKPDAEQGTHAETAFTRLSATTPPQPVRLLIGDQPPLVGTWHGGGMGTPKRLGGDLVVEPTITFPGGCCAGGEHHYSEGNGQPESRTCDHCGAGGCCAPSVPVEYCGDLSPSVFGEAPAECVLRPGHSARHSDNCGRRWWHTPDEGVTDSDSVGELRARLTAALRAIGQSEREIADLRAELRARDKVIAQQRAVAQRALCDVAAVARVRDLATRWYGQGAPATSYARELLAVLGNAA